MIRFRLKKGDFEKSVLHKYGEIYELVRVDSDGDFWLKTIDSDGSISDFAYFPKEVEQVFEPESKPLHNDTDLGYYAGLAMVEYIRQYGNGWNERIASESIATAKELIKQLDKESI